MPKLRKAPDWDNVPTATGTGTASLDVPLGETVHNIIIKLSGTAFTRAHIPRVRVIINGKAFIRDIPASIIHADNLSKGSKDDPSFLLLDFEEPRSRAFSDQILTAVGTAQGVSSFKVELDIVGATAPMLSAWYSCTADGRPLGPLSVMYKETYDAVTTGVKRIKPGYDKEAGHVWKRVHIATFDNANTSVAPATRFNYVTLLKNSLPVVEKLADDVNRYYMSHYEDVPQTGIFTVDFVQDNNTTINLMNTGDGACVWEVEFIAVAHLDMYICAVTTLDRM